MSAERDRVMALAALLQCARGVDLAAHGRGGVEDLLETAVRSTLRLEAADVDEIFGGPGALSPGLRMLSTGLEGDELQRPLRYGLAALGLAKALLRDAQAARALRADLATLEYPGGTPAPGLLARLDEIYQSRLRPLSKPIMVDGDPMVLSDPRTQARVRSLLLGAVRAAVLWQQRGGSLWRLLLQRGRMGDLARGLLVAG